MDTKITMSSLQNFLKSRIVRKNDIESTITHTRIGNQNYNIYGGSYCISKEETDVFHKIYYNHVFINKNSEYLTEKQLQKNGGIFIDFDFKYNSDVKERIHTEEHIKDIISVYLDELKKILIFDNRHFQILVMEKENVNILNEFNITKDGIHLIICIQLDKKIQMYLREKVLENIHEIIDLPLINEWSNVIDISICKGTTNWQLYGSCKPRNQPYILTYMYDCYLDQEDIEFVINDMDISSFDIEKNFHLLSARYENHVIFEVKDNHKYLLDGNIALTKSKKKLVILCSDSESDGKEIRYSDITNLEQLEQAMDRILDSLKVSEYYIKDIHLYTQILPKKYYEPGSHILNRQVAFALKNTDERLFLSWVMLRSKASDFEYSTIPRLYYIWKNNLNKNSNTITKRSIIYWAKQDAFTEYEEVKKQSIDHFIEQTLIDATEFDFATTLYYMYKDVFVCSNINNKEWYIFKNHKWMRDEGQRLRLCISRDLYSLYNDKLHNYLSELQSIENNDELYEKMRKKIKRISEISIKLKRTSDKNNIMREACELFYDSEFSSNIDKNPYLLCFTNGVIDFKNKIFRNGIPQDYITKCTNIPYIQLDSSLIQEFENYNISYEPYQQNEENTNDTINKHLLNDTNIVIDNSINKDSIDTFASSMSYEESENDKFKNIIKQICIFMGQLFPVKELRRYMWEHLASVLIGIKKEQVFNIYRGSGSNGKSILTDLMSICLGDYKGTLPITLVTEKRVSTGNTSSEVIQLKGVRFAVMQEPSSDAVINEGILKELTGGDPIQARALYANSEIFIPQFSLVVCTNSLFEIRSNDDGTWRRMKVVDFMSKFVSEGEKYIDNTPYIYVKDKSLKDKLPHMAPIFISILVHKVFQTDGVVKDCDEVIHASNQYRISQDILGSFVNECIKEEHGKHINSRELKYSLKEFLRDNAPHIKNNITKLYSELDKIMTLKYGVHKKDSKNGWKNMKIILKDEDEDVESDDDQYKK